MNRIVSFLRRHRRDAGITLVELLIAVGIGTTVTGVATASLVTALRSTDSVSQQTRESNDAQFISAYLVRDAQAVGGINPSTGATDATLGVSLTNDGGCSGTGSLVIRFAWNDRSGSATTAHTAAYFHDAITETFTRHSCVGTGNNSPLQLASEVAVVSAACTPTCAGLPTQVSLAVTSTNEMTNAPTAFSYTLSAAVRPQSRTGGPTVVDSTSVPLLTLGGTCPAFSLAGNTTVAVGGSLVVNTGNSGTCAAMVATGAGTYTASGSTLIAAGGTCSGGNCPTVSPLATPYADPFAALTPPTAICTGGSNPAPIGTVYQPGTYPLPLSITGTVSFAPGQYILCAGISFQAGAVVTGTDVFFYLASGTIGFSGQSSVSLSAPSTGSYSGILFWQASATPMTISGGATVNTYTGVIYAPNATVTLSGGAGSAIKSLIAASVIISGGGSSTFGNAPLLVNAPATLTTGLVGSAYSSVQISASGGTPAYTWSATGLPAGLTIDATTGAITGTPTAPGTSTVVVTVTDANTLTATASVGLTIGSSLAISGPATLTGGTVGTAYSSSQLSATGGTSPYSWAATNLPAGLTMNSGTGVISGTPTVSGISTVVVTVTDVALATATANFSLTVGLPSPPKPTSLLIANGNGTQGRPDRRDTITIEFDQVMGPSSFCAGWTGSSMSLVATIANGSGATPNDRLTVASSSGCTFNFGSIDLGSTEYVPGTTTYSGTGGNASTAVLTSTGLQSTLVIRMGAVASGSPATVDNTTIVATYAPSVAIMSTAGVGVSGNVSSTARHF